MINWWHSLFYVDNMVTTGNDVDEMENLKHYLASKFDVKVFFFLRGYGLMHFLEIEVVHFK